MATPWKTRGIWGPYGLPAEFWREELMGDLKNELLTPGMLKNVCLYYLTL